MLTSTFRSHPLPGVERIAAVMDTIVIHHINPRDQSYRKRNIIPATGIVLGVVKDYNECCKEGSLQLVKNCDDLCITIQSFSGTIHADRG